MKDLFPGHFKDSEENLKQVWDSCIFVFDANILLNFYRYSDTTRIDFIKLLEKIKERVWLPHRAAEEYLIRRLSVIGQQERSYENTDKSIKTLKRDLENARQHPFVSQKTMEQVNNVFDLLGVELSKNKSIHTERISNDEIKESISSIFENRVGQPYSRENLEKMIADGEERYRQNIPPGYKDRAKSGDSEVFIEKCRKYGDLIVWYQIIDKSKESKKEVVLVTDDRKEDWWEIFEGKTVGPRPELVKEFKDKTDSTIHMYQPNRFLELAEKYLGVKVALDAINEVREISDEYDDRLSLQSEALSFVAGLREWLAAHRVQDSLRHSKQMLAMTQATDEAQKNELWNAYSAYLIQSSTACNSEYDTKFKVKAIMLRNDLLRRVKHPDASVYAHQMYEHPTNPIGMGMVADDLELLARLL